MNIHKRHKILFISSWFPNKFEPTNGNFVQRHAEAVSLLHDVEVLHAIGDFNQKEKFVFDDQVVNGIRTLIVYYKNSKNPLQNFLRRMKAYQLGFKKMQKPDLVHGNVLHNNMLFAVYLKKKFGIPFVVTEHWTALREINRNKLPFQKKLIAKFIGNQSSMLLPVSKDLEKGLKSLPIKTKMKVVPNVVDDTVFKPKTSENEKITFIHVSSLIPRKNPEKIIEAAINLWEKGFDLNLKIGGDGDIKPLMNQIEKSSFRDKIEIFGELTISEVAEKMKNADCFILFSDDENQPCVIAESFASGIKVISTNVGGISEFFPDNFGILLEKVDVKLLEEAMIKVLNSELNSSKKEISHYAEQTFSKQKIAEKFSEIYNQVLS